MVISNREVFCFDLRMRMNENENENEQKFGMK